MSPDEKEQWDDFSTAGYRNDEYSPNALWMLEMKRQPLYSPNMFEHNTNASPQVTPVMPTISGDSNPSCIFQDHYVVDHPTNMGAQSSVEPISTPALNSVSSIENAKQLLKELIETTLEDLSNPEKETCMKNTLSMLVDSLSLFSEEQADKILEFLLDFLILVQSQRECYSQFQMYSQKYSAETEKIRDLVENSVREEKSLKDRQEKVEDEKKELLRQMEAVQKEKAEISKNLTKQEAHRNKEKHLMGITTTKLKDLTDQWNKLHSLFI